MLRSKPEGQKKTLIMTFGVLNPRRIKLNAITI
jgi:hypothetical protein